MPRTSSRRSLDPTNEGGIANASRQARTRSQSKARTLTGQTTVTHRSVGPHVIRNSSNKNIIASRQSWRIIRSFSPAPRHSLNIQSLSTPSDLLRTARPQQQSQQTLPEAAYNTVGLPEFASAVFDAPQPSFMLEDLASKLATSSDYIAACQRFLSSLESTSSTGTDSFEGHFVDLLDLICHQCHPLGSPDVSEFRAFAQPAYERGDSETSTKEQFVIMGMRRGPLPDDWSWADLLVAIDIQPADSSSLPHPHESSPPQHPILFDRHDDARGSKPRQLRSNTSFALPSYASHLRESVESAMTAKGNRRHVLGLLSKGPDVSFWYFDRGGGFFSTPLHLINDAVQIASAVMRLALSSAATFGLEPIIQSPSSWEAFESVKGSYVVVDGLRFLLEKTLHVSRELEGRGTVVFAARKGVEQEGQGSPRVADIPSDVIVKLSWQDVTMQSEDMLFRRAQECGTEGIAQLYCSSKPACLSTGPRPSLGLLAGIHYRDRELRVQVMGPLCVPLYRVKDIEMFKSAFRSLVEAHRSLYQRAGILHHDISINNLMVEKDNEAKGVLIDLDLAILVNGDVPLQHRPTIAGTLPFLSVDYLSDPPPRRHLYRHDLESFLFVLGWILARFNEEGVEINPDELDAWYTQPRTHMRNGKYGFFSWPFGSPASRFPSLQKSWVRELGQLFQHGYGIWHDNLDVKTFDEETLGGHVTYDSFLKILLGQ